MQWVIDYSFLIPLLPLLGAIVSGFFGAKWLKGKSHYPIWIGVGLAACMSIGLLHFMVRATQADGAGAISFTKNYFTWIQAGNFTVKWGYFFDPLTAVMLCVVC